MSNADIYKDFFRKFEAAVDDSINVVSAWPDGVQDLPVISISGPFLSRNKETFSRDDRSGSFMIKVFSKTLSDHLFHLDEVDRVLQSETFTIYGLNWSVLAQDDNIELAGGNAKVAIIEVSFRADGSRS